MSEIKTLGKIDAIVLSDFILENYGKMSHLKLQKLVYYCDAYHLAYFDVELVPQNFEAWVHGPVCREIYNNLKDHSVLHTDISKEFDKSNSPKDVIETILTTDQVSIIVDVLSELSGWTGLELEEATHRELPWVEARAGYSSGERCEVLIKKDTMRLYYKKELNG